MGKQGKENHRPSNGNTVQGYERSNGAISIHHASGTLQKGYIVKVVALMCDLHNLLVGKLEEFLKEESLSYTKRQLRGTEMKQSRRLDGLQTKSSLRLDFPLRGALYIQEGIVS